MIRKRKMSQTQATDEEDDDLNESVNSQDESET